jgi:hypothetical protein
MSTEVTWYPAADGRPDRLVGTTRTWNNVKLTGFTGSVLVLFVNDRGQTVGYSPVKHPLGVGASGSVAGAGRTPGSSTSRRTRPGARSGSRSSTAAATSTASSTRSRR